MSTVHEQAPALSADSPARAPLAADAAARLRALEIASFIVEAPAGAGKTELLTQRYLRLLATVDEPEEIIAITFTNKAAAEMRERIVRNLQVAASGVRPPEAHRALTFELATQALAHGSARGWQLLAQPGRLRITTIDALCAQLARQMPLLSRMGAQPAVAEDPDALYEAAARLAVEQVESRSPAIAQVVAASLRYLDNDAGRLVALLASMLARRDQWLARGAADGGIDGTQGTRVLQALIAREMGHALALLDPASQRTLQPLARYAAANQPDAFGLLADWHAPLAAHYADLARWQTLAELLLTNDDTVRKTVTVKQGFPAGKEGADQKKAMLAALAELAGRGDPSGLARLRRLPRLEGREDEAAVVTAFEQLLRIAAASLLAVFQERREIDFIEIAQRALQALGDLDPEARPAGDANDIDADDRGPTDLALRLDYQVRHLLVDEFQDTSPTQMTLLARLTAGWEAGDGRTLFCVGDPMQSIYRFRKADVGLFLAAAAGGIGDIPLEALSLCRNNRSCPPVIEWINDVFRDVFPACDDVPGGAIRYRPFVATRAPLAAAGTVVHARRLADDVGDELANRAEAREVLRIIDATWADDPRRDIAVLVRARTHLRELIGEIRRHRPDLRFEAVEVETLGARQWIDDLLTLTRALLQLADRVNWLALLRAPWCGLTLADLHTLAADAPQTAIWTLMHDAERLARLSDDGRERLLATRAALGEALRARGRQPLAAWLEGTWLLLGGAATLADAAALQDVRAYFDLIGRLDTRGAFALDALDRELERLYAAPDPAADGRLKFMTIHKSKGLEFDTVILPGLHRTVQDRDQPLLRWEEVAEGTRSHLIVAPLPRRRTSEASPYSFLQELERTRRRNEDIRVLYVAATRAVRALHLLGSAWADDADETTRGVRPPADGTPLALLWPRMVEQFANTPSTTAGELGSSDGPHLADFVPHLVRRRSTLVGSPWPVPGAPETAGTLPEAKGAVPARAVSFDLPPSYEAAVGTLTHRYLELIAAGDPAHWDAARLATLQPAMEAALRADGLDAADARRGAREVAGMLQTTLASEAGRWALAPRPTARAELALLQGDAEDGMQRHVIDRCFVDQGTRWIIDYKTTRLPDTAGGGAPEAARLRAEAESHRAQLARYAALFGGEGLPVRTGVLYTRHGVLVELDGGAAEDRGTPPTGSSVL